MKEILAAAVASALLIAASLVQAQPANVDEAGDAMLNAMGTTDMAQTEDPERDEAHPARNRQLLVPSHGVAMNALFLLAAGEGPKPTMLLLHGLPGNEQNLDLAQAVRRKGWNVLTLHYRGSWGSPGTFSIAGAIEDAEAAMDFLRLPETIARFDIDPNKVVIAGHSMGALAAAMHAAKADEGALAGVLLLDAWNPGDDAAMLAGGGAEALARYEAGFDDLGNSLQGATAASLAREVRDRGGAWDLRKLAPRLGRHKLFTIYATHGMREDNFALAEAIAAAMPRTCAGGEGEWCAERFWVREIKSDHSFADKRLELIGWVLRWLELWFADPSDQGTDSMVPETGPVRAH